MGTFHVSCRIENPARRRRAVTLPKVLVDTGSVFTWVPEATLERLGIAREKKDLAFVMANGQQVTRRVGFAIVRAAGTFTIDEGVFAEKGDLLLLGARTLEGLNLRVDAARKRLVAAGPLPAAVSSPRACTGSTMGTPCSGPSHLGGHRAGVLSWSR